MKAKTYAVSDQTRRALADALKTLMAQRPLEKISIRDITDLAGIRRQNFYYHFADVYDLLRWTIQEEAVSLLRQHEGALLWQEGLLQLFRYLEENRAFCQCTLHSAGREHLKRLVSADVYEIIYRTIRQIQSDLHLPETSAPNCDMELLTHFYVTALSGMVESWFLGEIERTPEQLVHFTDRLLQDHLRGVTARFPDIQA